MSTEITPAQSVAEINIDRMYLSPCPTLVGDHDEEKGSKEMLSETPNVATIESASLTPLRKILILSILSAAQFFDIFNAVASIVSLPQPSS
ncbi:hypothetical protein BDQ12DRAFT_729597 [Crucibulum laeve]|uniref:Uncharacterized protein n=1 Tax=Crucibulum laeve TaxID=68775 RepID=A0A5C3LFK8_9AGAR|nr:hypothetical protein BDQ12DRAFT_729597 [Crucibulum laeve]